MAAPLVMQCTKNAQARPSVRLTGSRAETDTPGVTRGLDPRVHRSSQERLFAKKMDGRVKPGHDAWGAISTSKTGLSPAGLTRGSITLPKKLFAKKMDGRVEPGPFGRLSRSNEFLA